MAAMAPSPPCSSPAPANSASAKFEDMLMTEPPPVSMMAGIPTLETQESAKEVEFDDGPWRRGR